MIGDVLYCCTIMVVLLVFLIWYAMIDGDSEHRLFFAGDYGRKVRAIRMWQFSFYLVFAILNFILSFMELKLNFTKIVAVIYNLISLMIFFYDAFIRNIKKDQYILILQDYVMKEIPISCLFSVEGNKAQYNLADNDETMLFKVVQAEQGKAICQQCKDGSVLLVPKNDMPSEELKFICKQINIYWTYNIELPQTVRCFEDKRVYKNIDEYVWELFPHIGFLFSPKTKLKIKKMITILGLLLMLTLAGLVLFDEFFCSNILPSLSTWLFE